VTAAQPYFYEVSRSSQSLRATVQRRVAGPVRVLAGAILQHTDYRLLPGPSVFQHDLTSGAIGAGTVPFSDHLVRGGLIVDNRDNELDPHHGVFAEGLVARGKGYTRTTGIARVWLHPVEKFFVAARLGVERMTGAPPVAAQQTLETSEQSVVALGGYRTLRGYYDARFTGPGKLLGGAELRYALLWAPSVLEVELVAFYDVGRVFAAGEPVQLTSHGLHKSAGGELALRFFRNAIVAVGYGRGSEGGQLLFGTTWSY
jgi:outer membrane protein assembly factor BamA